MKKQRYREGLFVKIPLNEHQFVVGRIVIKLLVFNRVFNNDDILPPLSTLNELPLMLAVGFFKDFVSSGEVEIIGHQKVTEEDLKRVPPTFHQAVGTNELHIFDYFTKESRLATPDECIGLEHLSVLSFNTLVTRIQDFLSGKKVEDFPSNKVKIYTDPKNLRIWHYYEKQD